MYETKQSLCVANVFTGSVRPITVIYVLANVLCSKELCTSSEKDNNMSRAHESTPHSSTPTKFSLIQRRCYRRLGMRSVLVRDNGWLDWTAPTEWNVVDSSKKLQTFFTQWLRLLGTLKERLDLDMCQGICADIFLWKRIKNLPRCCETSGILCLKNIVLPFLNFRSNNFKRSGLYTVVDNLRYFFSWTPSRRAWISPTREIELFVNYIRVCISEGKSLTDD